MPHHRPKHPIMPRIDQQLSQLIQFNRPARAWHMPVMAGIAASLPIFLAASIGRWQDGLIASLGAMVFLNLPYQGSFLFRMVQLLACSFGFVACFSLGFIAQVVPVMTLPLLGFIGFWVAVFGRYFRLAPPAGVFMIISAALGMFLPSQVHQMPYFIGVLSLGCLLSGMIACVYTLVLMYQQRDHSSAPSFGYADDMIVNSSIVAVAIVLSVAIALMLDLPRPYWAAASCFVIITGISFQSIWIKQLQRLIGTALGMLVAWWILSLNLSAWGVALAVMALVMIIETLVVRNYALAIVFVTPMTLLIAENGQIIETDHMQIILARFWDTLIGCLVGLVGGFVIHSPRLRPKLSAIDHSIRRRLHIL